MIDSQIGLFLYERETDGWTLMYYGLAEDFEILKYPNEVQQMDPDDDQIYQCVINAHKLRNLGLDIKQISQHQKYTIVLTQKGHLYVSGTDDTGMLGLGPIIDRLEFTRLSVVIAMKKFWVSTDVVVALDILNRLWRWGKLSPTARMIDMQYFSYTIASVDLTSNHFLTNCGRLYKYDFATTSQNNTPVLIKSIHKFVQMQPLNSIAVVLLDENNTLHCSNDIDKPIVFSNGLRINLWCVYKDGILVVDSDDTMIYKYDASSQIKIPRFWCQTEEIVEISTRGDHLVVTTNFSNLFYGEIAEGVFTSYFSGYEDMPKVLPVEPVTKIVKTTPVSNRPQPLRTITSFLPNNFHL